MTLADVHFSVGRRMTGSKWTGSFSEVDDCFKNVAAEYIRRIFGGDMKVKTDLLRRPMTADLLRSSLVAYSEVGLQLTMRHS